MLYNVTTKINLRPVEVGTFCRDVQHIVTISSQKMTYHPDEVSNQFRRFWFFLQVLFMHLKSTDQVVKK